MPNQCVSYESLRAALTETAKNDAVGLAYLPGQSFVNHDFSVQQLAQNAIKFLDQNPQSAKLLKEVLANSSCADLGQLVNGISGGVRDAALLQGLGELRGASAELRESIHYASDNLNKGVERAYHGFTEGSVLIAMATIIAAGMYYAGRLVKSRSAKN